MPLSLLLGKAGTGTHESRWRESICSYDDEMERQQVSGRAGTPPPPGPLVIPHAVLPRLTLLPTHSWDLLEERNRLYSTMSPGSGA